MDRFLITVDFYLLPAALDPFLALIKENGAAFDIHMKSRHFAEFNSASAPYVKNKKVVEYEYVNDEGK